MHKLKRLVVSTLRSLRPLFPQWLVNYLWHLPIAFFASRLYGNPSRDLTVIGVTGTDGKTTTTLLIYHLLKSARKKVAVISTVEAKIGRIRIKTGFHVTAPDPLPLQRLLRRIRSQKYRYVVLEATSHGIDQFRLFPIRPEIAVLTNITHEHLDYHKTYEHYRATKLKLFKYAKHAVINKDLPDFPVINQSLPRVHFSTYALRADSQLTPEHVRYLKGRTKFKLGNLEYELPLSGQYNLYNALAAISTCLILGVAPADIRRGLLTFPGVKGRLEVIGNQRGLTTIVDFAHTPNALEETLKNLRAQTPAGKKLIAVFGSAGLRDATKRPLMGAAAAAYADWIVITSEDPRTEDPGQIAKEIIAGIPESKRKRVKIELDRQTAINLAINKLAGRGDCVVVCGKGHEETMNLDGETETPWSDQEAVRVALLAK